MYRLACLAIGLIAASAMMSGCSSDPAVAEVDGQKILKSEFDRTFSAYKQQVEAQAGTDIWDQEENGKKKIDTAREKILDMLIEGRLIEKKAKELGVSVTDAALNKEIEATKGYFKTEAEFNDFLTKQKITLESLTDMIRKDLLFTSVYEKVNEGTAISDQDAEDYYKANESQFVEATASHILVATEAEAEAVKARLDKGEGFAALAKELSIDPSGKDNGGSLGTFGHGAMVEPFDKAVFAMKPGEISNPVKTKFGYHIIKCEKIEQKSMKDAVVTIKGQLLTEKKEKVYSAMIDKVKAASDIKKYTNKLN